MTTYFGFAIADSMLPDDADISKRCLSDNAAKALSRNTLRGVCQVIVPLVLMRQTMFNPCKNCKFTQANSSLEDVNASHFCTEQLGFDGYYTWGTPMFADLGEDVWYVVTNEMAYRKPTISDDGKPDCFAFSPHA